MLPQSGIHIYNIEIYKLENVPQRRAACMMDEYFRTTSVTSFIPCYNIPTVQQCHQSRLTLFYKIINQSPSLHITREPNFTQDNTI